MGKTYYQNFMIDFHFFAQNFPSKHLLVCSHMSWRGLQERRNFSLVAHYSLKFTLHSLLIAKFARYSLQNSLFTRCRSCSLLKITLCLLQNWLVIQCRSCWLQKIARYSLHNSLVTRCRSCFLQKFARCKKSLVARCKIRLLLIA